MTALLQLLLVHVLLFSALGLAMLVVRTSYLLLGRAAARGTGDRWDDRR